MSARALADERTAAAVRIQAFARAVMAAARYRRSVLAIALIQARWRCAAARIRLAAAAAAAAEAVEAAIRQAKREENAAITLQAVARGLSQRVKFTRLVEQGRVDRVRVAAVVLQAWWRTRMARARWTTARLVFGWGGAGEAREWVEMAGLGLDEVRAVVFRENVCAGFCFPVLWL